MFVTEMK